MPEIIAIQYIVGSRYCNKYIVDPRYCNTIYCWSQISQSMYCWLYNIFMVADIAINILTAKDMAIQYSLTIPIYFRTFEDMLYLSSYLLYVHMIVPT
jgi:hypothetical protein